MLKVAQYAAQLENYDRAIKIYEDVSIAHCHAQYISFCSSWFCASYKTKIRRFRRFLTGSLPILRIWPINLTIQTLKKDLTPTRGPYIVQVGCTVKGIWKSRTWRFSENDLDGIFSNSLYYPQTLFELCALKLIRRPFLLCPCHAESAWLHFLGQLARHWWLQS